jgi:hypothetical protein
VRDELWRKVTERQSLGYVLQLWSSRHPQGYDYRQVGHSKRMLSDFEGIGLVTIRKQTRKIRNAAWRGNPNSS